MIEQEVYGVDSYTYNQLLDSILERWHLRGEAAVVISEDEADAFIEDRVLVTLNRAGDRFTGKRAPMDLDLIPVIEELLEELKREGEGREGGAGKWAVVCSVMLAEMRFRQEHWKQWKYRAYRKVRALWFWRSRVYGSRVLGFQENLGLSGFMLLWEDEGEEGGVEGIM